MSNENLLMNKNLAEDNEEIQEHSISSSTSSMADDSSMIIVEETCDPRSITYILDVCKRKLLKPYMRFLSLMGLRPIIFAEPSDPAFRLLAKCFNVFYNIQVFLYFILGYFLQYMACFRRDRGFGSISQSTAPTKLLQKVVYDRTCSTSVISSFLIPSLLHLSGYIYALITFRRSDDEQLPMLIERVFLTSSHVPNMVSNQKVIVRTLWIFVISSFLWMFSSMTLVNYMMAEGDISFKWLDESPHWVEIILKVLLVLGTLWHDIVQASVISNYCLQVQLLKTYVHLIREKLLQQSLRPLEWIRDIEEFRKLLTYLNDEVSPAVCIFTVLNWTYAISGTMWLFDSKHAQDEIVPLYYGVNIMNVVLWWFIAAVPFLQASRLSLACERLKTVGQEVRTRPFVHQDTPVDELNSILIYTSSLKIQAKLFNLPITGKYIGFGFAVLSTYFLVFAQNNYNTR